MTTTQSIPRRKTATYGKTSHKPLPHHLSHPTFDAHRSSSDGPVSQSRISEVRLKASDTSMHPQHFSRSFGEVNVATDSERLLGACADPSLLPRWQDWTEDGPNNCFPKRLKTSDISLSDKDSTDVGFAQGVTRKKQKMPLTTSSTGLYKNRRRQDASTMDDKPPPATSSASTNLADVTRSLRLSLDSSRASSHTSHQVGHNVPTVHRKPLGLDVSKISKSKRIGAVSGARALESYERNSKHVATPSSNRTPRGLRGIHPSIAPAHTHSSGSPTPRTPTHPKRVAKATTPRQQELWSMLLPESDQTSNPKPRCPNYLDLSNLDSGAKSCVTPESPATGSARSFMPGIATRAAKHVFRGRRLIDKLQPAASMSQNCVKISSDPALLSDADGGDVLTLKRHSSYDAGLCYPPSDGGGPNFTDIVNKLPRSQRNGNQPISSGGRLKATYSSQRSYLANSGSDEAALFDVTFVDDNENKADKTLRRQPRTGTLSPGIELIENVEEEENDGSQGSSMRTIHELRESGESIRHLNETEAILDDIDGHGLTSMGLKRRRLLDLVRRLQEPAFCRVLLDQQFDNRLLSESASKDNDAVTDALLAMAVLYLVAAPLGRQAAPQSYDLRVADFFANKLNHDQALIDLILSRRCNISRQDQSDLEVYFFQTVPQSPLWRSGAPAKLSSRLIALQGLDYLMRKKREAGCRSEILPPKTIQRLVETLPPCRGTAKSSADLLLETRLAISVLESHTISGVSLDNQQWTEKTLGPITSVLSWLPCYPQNWSEDTQKLTLRLYLNLTNNNPQLCEAFASREVVENVLSIVQSHFHSISSSKRDFDGRNDLDTLILALGALINLVEWSTSVRHIMTSNEEQDECCVKALAGLFVARREMVAEVYSEEETSSNVAFGYLSVLLSYLCVEDHARRIVQHELPGGKLQSLLDTVEEFLNYHRQIDEDMDVDDGEMGVKASFIGRLESTVFMLRQMDKAAGDEKTL
ncbi:MAG: hypothetical protein Q9200_006858 [Gallowayella weberi]